MRKQPTRDRVASGSSWAEMTAPGTVTVTATAEGVQGSATLTVNEGPSEPCGSLEKPCPKVPTIDDELISRAPVSGAKAALPRRRP